MPTTQDYSLSREEAAEALRVSVRTIDRYIRRRYFDVKRSGRQVWISRPSFEDYFEAHQHEQESTKFAEAAGSDGTEALARADLPVDISETDLSEMRGAPTRQAPTPTPSIETPLRAEFTPHAHSYERDLAPAQIYKTLYEELKEKHDEQVKRLEGAHYRVGQLEAQVKSMIPLTDHKREQKQLLLVNEQYKATVQEAQLKLTDAKHRVRREQLNKNAYISLVYGLLALHVVFWALLR